MGMTLRSYISGNQITSGSQVFNISARQYERVFKAAAQQALNRDAHPHQLRHLYAKLLIDAGIPVAAAAKMLGHANSKTTEQWYYDLTSQQRYDINRKMPI